MYLKESLTQDLPVRFVPTMCPLRKSRRRMQAEGGRAIALAEVRLGDRLLPYLELKSKQ